MPNPWDVGSARLLEAIGFQALATTSAGFAWSIGKLDQSVTRDELVAHVATLAHATSVPLNVDSERCYPDEPGGVAETVALLAGAGAAGLSIEDYDPATGAMDDVDVAAQRVAEVAEAAHQLSDPMVVTGRAENHIRGDIRRQHGDWAPFSLFSFPSFFMLAEPRCYATHLQRTGWYWWIGDDMGTRSLRHRGSCPNRRRWAQNAVAFLLSSTRTSNSAFHKTRQSQKRIESFENGPVHATRQGFYRCRNTLGAQPS